MRYGTKKPYNRKALRGLTKKDNDDKFGKYVLLFSSCAISFNIFMRSIRNQSIILPVTF
jgi:hypothetical protein